MYCLRRMVIWALRLRYCRGFGVQSPWAYSFIRYVINEHYPYYAYEFLAGRYPEQSALSHKLNLLYFRMANYLQPKVVVDCGLHTRSFAAYVSAGCKKATLRVVNADESEKSVRDILNDLESVSMARFSPVTGVEKLYRALLDKITPESIYVVEGIHTTKIGRRLWREILHDESTGVTFDLYYCGVVCFDRKKYRQNYIVNF